MAREPYGTLAGIYEWLMPENLLTPAGSVHAFAPVVDALAAGARVLDCAAGIGHLAVGLALRGFDVAAADASPAMVKRTAALAADHGAELAAVTCPWERLGEQGWAERFDAVFCVGNSLVHAPGRPARRDALRQMAGVLRPGGLLVLTSRNWEAVRARGSGLSVEDRVAERDGRRGLVVQGWSIADGWDDRHHLDVAVALIDADGGVTSHAERLAIWPFRHEALDEDLRAAGLSPRSSTYARDVERYLVTAARA
jgi:SAM-dependent methyltransferase